MQIGFLSRKPEPVVQMPRDDYIVRFDSGASIGIEDALRHMLVLGMTGTGKTVSFIIPVLYRHMLAGHAGLIIDIKGNMLGKIRGLARAAGRESDVLEFGTAPGSLPLNLVAGMSPARFRDTMRAFLDRAINGQSHNMDFHYKAIQIATDAYTMLMWLAERDKTYTPTLSLIAEMYGNVQQASRLFAYFAKLPDLTEEQKAFVASVSSNRFHILSQTPEVQKRGGSTHFEQLNYYTQTMDALLREFLSSPGIEEKFCDKDAPGIDMGEIFESGKICVLNFMPETGPVGASLARDIVNAAYKTIYEKGTGGKVKFICIDEFQEMADLSGGRYSDASFIALAREFRTSFICATQSASALLSSGFPASVSSFISNLSTKIFFHTDDPATRLIAKYYDPDVDLVALAPREAFVSYFDGEYRHGMETMNEMYKETKDIEPMQAQATQQSRLSVLAENVSEKTANAQDEKTGRPTANMVKKYEPRRQVPKSPLALKFGSLFTPDAFVSVPVGLIPFVEKALAYFESLDLGVRISSLKLSHHGTMKAIPESHDMSEIYVLNDLLAVTSKLCVRCGGLLQQEEDEENADSISVYEYLQDICTCPHCLEQYMPKLMIPIPQKPQEEKKENDKDYPEFS